MADPETSQEPHPHGDGLNNGRRKRRARPWHRVIGLLTALPLLWVVITGAILNHTVDWKLDQRMVHHPWVMKAYGMNPVGEPEVVTVGSHRIAAWDGLIFMNGAPIEISGDLLGAVEDAGGVAVVTTSNVLRLDGDGAQVELIGSESLPTTPLTGVRRDQDRVFLRNKDGWHEVMDDWLDFSESQSTGKAQVLRQLPDGAERRILYKAWANGGLPASRILLDLHTGHFLGDFGRYFNDLMTLATIVLCVTGVILFFRTPRRAR